ncbi:hypothetical protein BMS3Bbin07_00005 [bacterium BMS3Bbin07]|nr:hypothetical protein BMS3Bbin07_00005 [bacterium BMS3Bbin07]
MELFSVRGTDTCAFLSPVLKGIEAKICKVGCLGMAVYTKNPALFLDIMYVFIYSRHFQDRNLLTRSGIRVERCTKRSIFSVDNICIKIYIPDIRLYHKTLTFSALKPQNHLDGKRESGKIDICISTLTLSARS